jgi:poly(A) polymerase
MEVIKLLVAPHAIATLVAMAETGLLEQVLGGVPLLASFANVVKLEAALGLAADSARRLGALAVMVSEDADRLRERLRLANAEYDRLTSIGDGWWRVSPAAGEHAARVLLYHLRAEKFTDRALIAWSRSPAGVADAAWRDFAALPARWTVPAFPLRAADFVARGVARGPALGVAMRAAENAWVAADFPCDPAALERIAGAGLAAAAR